MGHYLLVGITVDSISLICSVVIVILFNLFIMLVHATFRWFLIDNDYCRQCIAWEYNNRSLWLL